MGPAAQIDILETLQRHPILGKLSSEALLEVHAASTLWRYPQRRIFIREGASPEAVYVLLHGSARVYMGSDDGKEYTPIVLQPPAIIGEIEVLAGSRFLENVITLEPSLVLKIPATIFVRTTNLSHDVAVCLLQDMAGRFTSAISNERSLAFDDVRTRLARLLVTFAEGNGTAVATGKRIRLPLTQDDMANAIAVRRRAVNRELSRWQKDHVVKRVAGHYIVSDLNQLKREILGRSLSTPQLDVR